MPSPDGDSFGSVEDLMAYLTAIETTVEGEVSKIADSFDAMTDRISDSLRSTLGDQSWLPKSNKPSPPPPATIATPLGYFEASKDWVSRHRAITAAVVCFLGTGAFLIWRERRRNRVKRRARRGKNGQRTDVVILAGPPSAPLTRSLSLDLERRGFIVYIPVNSLWEERLIQAESKADIHPLHLDVTSPSSLASTIRKVTALLHPSEAAKYPLRFVSLIILPQTPSPPRTHGIAQISADSWSDAFSIHLLSPFTLIQAILPLMIPHKSSLLFLNHTNSPSLSPPLTGEANVVAHALDSYISTFRKEFAAIGDINIVQFKLGAIDYESDRDALQMAVALRYDDRATSNPKSDRLPEEKKVRGSPFRQLHLEVFDAIVGKRRGTVYVGRGARTYGILGKIIPQGIAQWMLSLKAQEEKGQDQKIEGDHADGSQGSPGWEKVDQIGGEEST
ncbi:MAG: hypothetical protein Q9168_005034 [Polycauliona sp. 1 TL-2023]